MVDFCLNCKKGMKTESCQHCFKELVPRPTIVCLDKTIHFCGKFCFLKYLEAVYERAKVVNSDSVYGMKRVDDLVGHFKKNIQVVNNRFSKIKK